MNATPSYHPSIVFLGAGNMAEALVKGILKAGLYPAEAVFMTDVEAQRLAHFKTTYGIAGSPHNAEAVRGAAMVVLAVKPQILPGVVKEIASACSQSTLVVSIAAGIATGRLEALLGSGTRVVRVMPNMPAVVGAGAAALCGGKWATPQDLARVAKLFQAVGAVVPVDESLMDAVTALSGSGPAYVFYLVEAMLTAAISMGLDEATARHLTVATLSGAARMLAETGHAPQALRQRVTSKGGTTAAAVAVLQDKKVQEILVEAIRAAHRRARELSSQTDA